MRPQPDEYAASYADYVGLVPESDVLAVLREQQSALAALASAVPPEKERFAYAPGKWSVRQLVGHLGDGERVFGFRAFSFSRRESAPLPGFDEDAYVDRAPFAALPLAALVDELVHLRAANLHLLAGLRADQWSAIGTANRHPISVRALAFVMAGHARHHLAVLRERYGVAASG